MKKIFGILLGAAAGYYLGLWYVQKTRAAQVQAASVPRPLQPVPAGAQQTGKIQITETGRKPGYPGEVLGIFKPRKWAEVSFPDGHLDWVEVA